MGTDFPRLQTIAKSFITQLYENSIDPNEVASISLNKSTLTMVTGDVETLTATVLPTTALDRDVEWSSTNASVATVSDKGVVTAVGPGNATIIAKTVDGGLTATCKVSVVTLAQEITFDCTELEIYNGESYTLQATVLPEDTSNKSLSWASSNTAVATVDENGTITPVKAGTTTITATSMDGTGIKCSCQVTVLQRSESITLDAESAFLYIGDKKQLTATILPADASNQKVVWSSSDDTIASVDQEGLVTALKVGKVQITATAEEGALKAVCEVEVAAFVSGIKFDKNELELYNGDTYTLQATILPEDANNKTLSWSSSSPTIATVDENGMITAIAAGTATITATATDESGITATCKVTVLQHVESVTLSRTSGSMYVGEAKSLTATVLPENASNKNVVWSSTNEAVATVDQTGLVSAHKAGQTQIVATTEEGGLTAACDVTVNQYVTEIALDAVTATLYTNETLQLNATVAPNDATNKSVAWTSSNPTVASVDQNGLVTALSAGSAMITVAAQDGSGIENSCAVTVKQRVESVSLDQTAVSLMAGNTQQLTATVLPTSASNKNVVWSSSDSAIASVSQSGLVTAHKAGSAQITVTTEDGGYTASCVVSVGQYVSQIALDATTATLYTNETLQLNATVTPNDATNKSVAWTSSNPTVASVDQNGLVTALSTGSATITVAAQDGSGIENSCVVTVKQHVESVSLDQTSTLLFVGETQQLMATISPADATNKNVVWSSSDSAIASVSQSGVVTANGIGSAQITATTEDGGFTAMCEVAVYTLSQTPTHLALSVQRNGVRYYVPQSEYANANLTGCTKEGVVIISSSGTFIYDLYDTFNSTTVIAINSSFLSTLPTQDQAQIIVNNWANINSAVVLYGGTSVNNKTYWTKTAKSYYSSAGASVGTGTIIKRYYYYNSSGVNVSDKSVTNESYYARKVIATL
ncbi:MAG: Ig-like domain-containing protein [Alistipes sp.]|nr:Ig-like domain-containing protein [Alistipes sp.]